MAKMQSSILELVSDMVDHDKRLIRLESVIPFLATKEDFSRLTTEITWVKFLLGGVFSAIVMQIIISAMGLVR